MNDIARDILKLSRDLLSFGGVPGSNEAIIGYIGKSTYTIAIPNSSSDIQSDMSNNVPGKQRKKGDVANESGYKVYFYKRSEATKVRDWLKGLGHRIDYETVWGGKDYKLASGFNMARMFTAMSSRAAIDLIEDVMGRSAYFNVKVIPYKGFNIVVFNTKEGGKEMYPPSPLKEIFYALNDYGESYMDKPKGYKKMADAVRAEKKTLDKLMSGE